MQKQKQAAGCRLRVAQEVILTKVMRAHSFKAGINTTI